MEKQEKYKFYRILMDESEPKDLSPLSQQLNSITGFYSNEYIKTVKPGGQLHSIIADESIFKNNFCSSLVLFPFLDKAFEQNLSMQLLELITKFNLTSIHFTELFGSRNSGVQNRQKFLEEYAEIASQIPFACVSLSEARDRLTDGVEMSNEEIHFMLFWNNFERVIEACEEFSVFHIWHEQEYSLEKEEYELVAMRLSNKLYSGLEQVLDQSHKYISVCRHPHFFTKKALLYSSVADLGAYACNKLKQKIDSGVPLKKIQRDNKELIRLFKRIFVNYTGVPSKEVFDLIYSTE